MRSASTTFDGPDPTGTESWDRNRKGNVAEAAVMFHAVRLGVDVFRPLQEHGRYDLVLEIGGRLQRVQCKWARRTGDVLIITLASSRLTPAGYVRTHYSEDQIDAIAAYCADLDRCYFIPAGQVAGRSVIYLRLAATRNGQKARLHWAAEYELSVIAAQQTRESSRAVDADVPVPAARARPDGRMVVSAHDFRGQFGHYMERVGKGEEITITRHSRPFARLIPAPTLDPQ